jgi:hypothetical protein
MPQSGAWQVTVATVEPWAVLRVFRGPLWLCLAIRDQSQAQGLWAAVSPVGS